MDRELESHEVEAESDGAVDEQIVERFEDYADEHESEEDIPGANGAALEVATEHAAPDGGASVAAPGIDAKVDKQRRTQFEQREKKRAKKTKKRTARRAAGKE